MAKECEYCSYFEEVPSKLRTKEKVSENKFIYRRKCPFTKDFITGDHEACEHYIPGKWFWCKENQEKVSQAICLSRKKKKNYCCPSFCYQYNCVLSGRRGYRPNTNDKNGIIPIVRRKV